MRRLLLLLILSLVFPCSLWAVNIDDITLGTADTLFDQIATSNLLAIPFDKNAVSPDDTSKCWIMRAIGGGATYGTDIIYSTDGGETWGSPQHENDHVDEHSTMTPIGGDSVMIWWRNTSTTYWNTQVINGITGRTIQLLDNNTVADPIGFPWWDKESSPERVWASSLDWTLADADTFSCNAYWSSNGGIDWTKQGVIEDIDITSIRAGLAGKYGGYPWWLLFKDVGSYSGYFTYKVWNGSGWDHPADSIITDGSSSIFSNMDIGTERSFDWLIIPDYNDGADTLQLIVNGRGSAITDIHLAIYWKYFEGGTGDWNADTISITNSSYMVSGNSYAPVFTVLGNNRIFVTYTDIIGDSPPDSVIMMQEVAFPTSSTIDISDTLRVNTTDDGDLWPGNGGTIQGIIGHGKYRGWVTYWADNYVIYRSVILAQTGQSRPFCPFGNRQ